MFTVAELLEATGGQLLKGNPLDIVANISIDSRTLLPNDAFIAIVGKTFDGHQFITDAIKKGADTVILHKIDSDFKGANNIILVNNTTDALLKIAGVHRKKFLVKVIAVAGSNGKTTTKEMISAILEKNYRVVKAKNSYNNEIGVALTLLQISSQTEIVVLEMEMNELGGIKRLCDQAFPHIGVITNIGDAHLEFLKDRQGVAREKQELLAAISNSGSAVLNGDDPLVKKIAQPFSFSKKVFYGINNKNLNLWAEKVVNRYEDGSECLLNGRYRLRLNLPGLYNIYNALAAVGVGLLLDIDYPEIIKNLKNFHPLPMRMERIELKAGIVVFNDAYNANPQSMIEALKIFSRFPGNRRKIVVLGDMCELGEKSIYFHQMIGEFFPAQIDILITVGKYATYIAEMVKRRQKNIKIYSFEDSSEAAHKVVDIVKNNDKILFKGSRAVRLETIVEKLREKYDE
jgi:UDP-N-acetylmuramoyl-tripeptide--D-alanyl-D-alanine ligase